MAVFPEVLSIRFWALPNLYLKLYWLIHFAFPAFAKSLAVPRYLAGLITLNPEGPVFERIYLGYLEKYRFY